MQSNQIRTTIFLDRDLLIAAKKKAIQERTSLTDLVRRGLRSQIYYFNSSVCKVPDILSFEGIFKTKKKIPFKKARKAFGEYLARRSSKINE